MFQAFAYHLIKIKQVARRNTLAIRRVSDDNALFCRLFKLLERLNLQDYIFSNTGSLHVMSGNFVSFRIIVITVDFMIELALLRIIIVYRIEQILIEVFPFLESELLTEYARSNVTCYKSRFDRNSTRTTHRVNQIAFASPSGHQNHTGSQYLVKRSFYLLLTVATTMK